MMSQRWKPTYEFGSVPALLQPSKWTLGWKSGFVQSSSFVIRLRVDVAGDQVWFD
jgi:hypothetical protein